MTTENVTSDEPTECPYCGSEDLKHKPLPGYLPWECADCGHLFDTGIPNLDAYDDEDEPRILPAEPEEDDA
jgi:DNA-directed RNA polymerase subunit RPC12/RpoP